MKKVLALTLALVLMLGTLALPAMAAAKTTITLDRTGTVTMNVNEDLQLTATVTPAAAVTWKSSKKGVASVDGSGLVSAHKEGTVTITAKAGGKTAKVKVKVVDPTKPTGLTIDYGAAFTLNIDQELPIAVTFAPEDAYSELKYKVSNKKVATVKNHVIVPRKEGKTKITVYCARNKKAKATTTITVKDPYKPTKVIIGEGARKELTVGETLQLTTTLEPDTAKSDLTFTSSNKKIASVDKATGKVTAKKKGTVKITVTSKKNKKAKATITIKVNPVPPSSNLADYIGWNANKLKSSLKLKAQNGYAKVAVLVGDGFYFYTDADTVKKINSKTCILGVRLTKANGKNILGLTVGMPYAQAESKLLGAGWMKGDTDQEEGENGPTGITQQTFEKEDSSGYHLFRVEYGKDGVVTGLDL